MSVKIIAFGQIAEIIGKEVTIETETTNLLQLQLIEKYPTLSEKKFAIAVNKKVVTQNTNLNPNDVVALMPPYSGG